MTPAERLTAAADLLDKRASEATEGPWFNTRDGEVKNAKSWDVVDRMGAGSKDARYIAAMDPEKGKFLVEWLREEAAEARIYRGANPEHLFRHALGFADLLLAGAS